MPRKLKTVATARVALTLLPVAPTQRTRRQAAAAEAMWAYYKDNKPQLRSDIRDYREHILVQLCAGADVASVFAPFVRAVAPQVTKRLAA
jgi:hypothetical protein